ncbi:hypothetical protein K435DRAFT_972393 [Dendrothele bispora CBS 962.96]|uniref:TPR-like protein n=1 Tax=Dendrothele bispora (strain CBS 962.96) TaxID=1314807 RepID=A0A4S8KZ86_DENBC|nr:hypothetical protein K435DRAFT_972393 [Dendrothele bispora CBS 962.96]
MLMWNASWKEAESEIQKVREKTIENGNNDARSWQGIVRLEDLQDKNNGVANMVPETQIQFEEIGDQWRAAQCLQRLGKIHSMQGRCSAAADMLSNAHRQFEKIGNQLEAASGKSPLGQRLSKSTMALGSN